MAWAGKDIYFAAARALMHGTTNMNTLVSLGTGVAFLYSAYSTIMPGPDHQVYFDAVLLILGFLLLGKALEARAKRRARAALDALSRLQPATARRYIDGVQTLVPLEEIRIGDDVLVLPGERFPVDAKIAEGRTSVDESMLTGEATPLPREKGDRVLAGSMNYDGTRWCAKPNRWARIPYLHRSRAWFNRRSRHEPPRSALPTAPAQSSFRLYLYWLSSRLPCGF